MKVITIFSLILLFINYEAQSQKNKLIRQSVIDKGSFFTSTESTKLNEYLYQLDKKTLVQTLLYTESSLEGKSLESYTLEVANNYGIGIKGANNGVGIFLFKTERKVRIVVGFGMEWIIPDSILQKIVDSMTPFFKQNKFYKGIRKAFKQIQKQNHKVDWQIYNLPQKLSKIQNQKIFTLKYTSPKTKLDYIKTSQEGLQFSDDFKIPLMINNQLYDLYYSKYMNSLVTKIHDDTPRTIWFRLIDYKTKRLELLGVE